MRNTGPDYSRLSQHRKMKAVIMMLMTMTRSYLILIMLMMIMTTMMMKRMMMMMMMNFIHVSMYLADANWGHNIKIK